MVEWLVPVVVLGSREIKRLWDERKKKKRAEAVARHNNMVAAVQYIRDKMIMPGKVTGFEEIGGL